MTQRLAERSHLYIFGIAEDVLAASSRTSSHVTQEGALDSASAQALGMLGNRYLAPLVSWDDDLRKAVSQIAAYDLLCVRGFNPAAGADVNIRLRNEDAVAWLKSVARQEITPSIVGANTSPATYDAPRVLGLPSQGWQGRRIG